jgi:hypothetical protein
MAENAKAGDLKPALPDLKRIRQDVRGLGERAHI